MLGLGGGCGNIGSFVSALSTVLCGRACTARGELSTWMRGHCGAIAGWSGKG